jgi:hypothetical protein
LGNYWNRVGVDARWENGEAGVRQFIEAIEAKGGTKLHTKLEVARSVIGFKRLVKKKSFVSGRDYSPIF